MRNTGNSLIGTDRDLDEHMSGDRLRGEATFGPLVLSFDTPADGEGATDILALSLDPKLSTKGADLESLITESIAAVLQAVDADWTSLIHSRRPARPCR